MEKKLITICSIILFVVGTASAATVYTNRTNWESAVCGYEEEFFTDATLNPGVSVVSTVGYVHAAGYWWDRVDDGDWYGDGKVRDTTWSFAIPMAAWGGTFDAAGPGGPGSSIVVELVDGTPVYVGTIPNTIAGTFWGFVSDTPFVKVHLKDAALIVGACETYHMDNMVYSSIIEVEIDIKPGSYPNSINPESKGVIPVAILSTPTFDATTVDPETVRFGPGEASMAHEDAHLEDVDGDGDVDMVLHFKTQDTGISAGDTEATLTGSTTGGITISGTDSVRTVPKGKK